MSVSVTVSGRLAVVAMERPEKRNAVDHEMTRQLDAALNRIEDDPELWVGVLTGTDSGFSAGTDLRSAGHLVTERGGEYGVIRRTRSKPLVAAVEGPAYGGGFEIVLSCDLVVAGRTATFGLPEVKRGLVANCGALFRLPRVVPLNVARELVATGDPIDAGRAYELGLVNQVVEPGQARAAACALAERICANGPLAVRASLTAVNAVVGADEAAGWAATEVAVAAIAGTADRQEGIDAFLEKRPPVWRGG
jgi:enoyl-CoA hydratase/carnithine racemase